MAPLQEKQIRSDWWRDSITLRPCRIGWTILGRLPRKELPVAV